MEYEIIQTTSRLSAAYEMLQGTKRIGGCRLDNNLTHGGTLEIRFLGTPYSMSYTGAGQVKSWIKRRPNKTNVPYEIYQGNDLVGQVFHRFSDDRLLKFYEYEVMELYGREYQQYEIGLGKQGICYSIYEGDTQIAQIDKDSVVRNNLDRYAVTALDESAGIVACLFGLYTDIRSFASRGEIQKSGQRRTYSVTTNETLKSKYDPGFKNRVKGMMG